MINAAEKDLSSLIKAKAIDLGFDLCGIAASEALKEHEPVIKNWCSHGMNGEMNYLCRNIEKRTDPGKLFPGSRSVIVTGLNYYKDKRQGGGGIPVISRYAYGANYHDLIITKLNAILDYINTLKPDTHGKAFVDSAPVLEKAWARKAGLGWPGRHSVLINPEIGSFFFLGVILINIELDYDNPFKEDRCGTCRICIEACPTGAINDNRTLNAPRCIAYLTISGKAPVNDELVQKLEGRVFGCDRCQEVCPWNKDIKSHKTPQFEISSELRLMTAQDYLNLSEEEYKRLFKGSVIEERKYKYFIRNVKNVVK